MFIYVNCYNADPCRVNFCSNRKITVVIWPVGFSKAKQVKQSHIPIK